MAYISVAVQKMYRKELIHAEQHLMKDIFLLSKNLYNFSLIWFSPPWKARIMAK
ncbi:hypothetical protein RO3G_13374 [Rhizopus delemar RA 99-880]|uniref:Uncharacterized protein n=1 Tax=Rhizopus delemar (strain RA 99-880 / ATCC MYA-4621 / FGSC 9543 / NRRL 43880) TaxID=246409 RepID=I1CJN3_RHIO9|nr:hypothetical protein RO3G_13374 [Rhizopus delemar RA 99-880]|eukprot:EIE88663.1 hypothetical protein RO3G_13374 [Rhizopus delemar RA 99-880]